MERKKRVSKYAGALLASTCKHHGDTHRYASSKTLNNCVVCHRARARERYERLKKTRGDGKYSVGVCAEHGRSVLMYNRTGGTRCVLCVQLTVMRRSRAGASPEVTPQLQLNIMEQQDCRCAICGRRFNFEILPANNAETALCHKDYEKVSWDRLNTDRHYAPDNLQATCWLCNKRRSDMDSDAFRALARCMHERLNLGRRPSPACAAVAMRGLLAKSAKISGGGDSAMLTFERRRCDVHGDGSEFRKSPASPSPQCVLCEKFRGMQKRRRGDTTVDVRQLALDAECALCGLPIPEREGLSVRPYCPLGPSVDRIDNDRGYEPGNIHTTHLYCNKLKGATTMDELKRWAEAVVAGTHNPLVSAVRVVGLASKGQR